MLMLNSFANPLITNASRHCAATPGRRCRLLHHCSLETPQSFAVLLREGGITECLESEDVLDFLLVLLGHLEIENVLAFLLALVGGVGHGGGVRIRSHSISLERALLAAKVPRGRRSKLQGEICLGRGAIASREAVFGSGRSRALTEARAQVSV